MKITKTLLPALAAALCLGLCACSPKTMEAFAAWQPEIRLYAGDSWEGEIPGDSDSAEYVISVNNVPGLEARLEGDKLILLATRPGDGQITLSATAKGYHDTNLTIPVQIDSRSLELDWTAQGEPPAEGEGEYLWTEDGEISLLAGKTFDLVFTETYDFTTVMENTSITAALDPEELGTLQVGEKGLTFTAGEKQGRGTLEVTASAPNYEDAHFSIPVSVVRGKLPLSVTANGTEIDEIDMENGSTYVLKVTAGGGEIDAQLDCPTAKMTKNGSAYAITATDIGEGSLTVTASGEGWLSSTLELPVTITRTKAVVTPAAAQVNVEPGNKTTVELTTKPQGAQVSASVSGDGSFTASVSGSTLTIAADENATGAAEITLTVIAANYADGSAKVTATAKLEPIALSLSKGELSLEEGESKAVTVTVSPAGCKLEAKASGGVSAELSGNQLTITGEEAGSGSVSVTASSEGREPVTKTVKVTVTEPIVLPNVDTTTYAQEAAEIIRLTNQYREQNGQKALSHVSIVDIPATVRAEEAAEVWSHTRPDGSNFNTVFTECGLKYTAYGENLFAVNTSYTPEEVLQAWKDSPAHNENLLRSNFNGIGVGIAYIGGEYYYCQLFIQR